jgi:hypothetical protein
VTDSRTYPLGTTEYVTMTVTGPATADLSLDPFEVVIVDASLRTVPATAVWAAPDLKQLGPANVNGKVDTVKVGILLGPLGGSVQLAAGRWRLWARLTDSPEVPWVPCPVAFRVVA